MFVLSQQESGSKWCPTQPPKGFSAHTHTLMSISILFHDRCALIAFYIGFYLYCNNYLPYIYLYINIYLDTY